MALDTAQKRYSMMGLGGPMRTMLPPPDGGFTTQADRQQLTYLYSGILAAAGSTATGVNVIMAAAFRSGLIPNTPTLAALRSGRSGPVAPPDADQVVPEPHRPR